MTRQYFPGRTVKRACPCGVIFYVSRPSDKRRYHDAACRNTYQAQATRERRDQARQAPQDEPRPAMSRWVERYRRRLAEGRCGTCGSRELQTTTQCAACLWKVRKRPEPEPRAVIMVPDEPLPIREYEGQEWTVQFPRPSVDGSIRGGSVLPGRETRPVVTT